jgi:hypothetical protein
VIHIETLARWKRREIEKIVERAMTISLSPRNLRRAISTWVLILTPADATADLPEKMERPRGELETKLGVRYRMVWLIPARELLDMSRDAVLPLIPLSDHTMSELEEAVGRLRERHDEELISQFLVHARVRYSEEEVARFAKMLEKQTMELLAEIKEVKDLRRKAKREGRESGRQEGLEEGRKEGRKEGRQEGRQEGRKEGRQEGLEEGRLIGIREAIRQALAERYPSVVNEPAIEGIDDYDRAQRIFSAVLRARSAGEAAAALRG